MLDDEGLLDTTAAIDPAGAVHAPTVAGFPDGYAYGVTRYGDLILSEAFPDHFADLVAALEAFDARLTELQSGGGNRTPFVTRFDAALEQRGWGKRTIAIGKTIDGVALYEVRGHEIDMFTEGRQGKPYPGIAVEMEWSNKDPFFDRDLLNFQALHREGALAVGVIVTRGPRLQDLIKPIIRNPKGEEKYGESTTHWNKLVPRVNLGGGGECPLLLIGIEPERIIGVEIALEVQRDLASIAADRAAWRLHYSSWAEAQATLNARRLAALAKLSDPGTQ